jgi:hypothetical protein
MSGTLGLGEASFSLQRYQVSLSINPVFSDDRGLSTLTSGDRKATLLGDY